MERAGTIGLDIMSELENVPFRRKDVRYKEINGVLVKMSSQRYAVFQKSVTCTKCGISGSFFAIERADFPENVRYHLNLYAKDKNGNEVLMTKDHIVPASKGGRSILSNYQTMCVRCNSKKGNKVEE